MALEEVRREIVEYYDSHGYDVRILDADDTRLRVTDRVSITLRRKSDMPFSAITPEILLEARVDPYADQPTMTGEAYVYVFGEEVCNFGIGPVRMEALTLYELFKCALSMFEASDISYEMRRYAIARSTVVTVARHPRDLLDHGQEIAYEIETVLDRYGYEAAGTFRIKKKL